PLSPYPTLSRSTPPPPSPAPPFLHPRGLTGPFPQVVEAGPPHVAPPHHLDLVNARRVQGEGPLHPDALGHLADGEGLAEPAAVAAQDDAFKHLDALPVGLHHFDVDPHRIPGAKIRHIVPHLLLFQLANDIHGQPTPRC